MTIAPWLQAVLWASFYGSALALAVLALQKVLGRVLSARWAMILWGIVLIIVGLLVGPGGVSIFDTDDDDAGAVAAASTPAAVIVER